MINADHSNLKTCVFFSQSTNTNTQFEQCPCSLLDERDFTGFWILIKFYVFHRKSFSQALHSYTIRSLHRIFSADKKPLSIKISFYSNKKQIEKRISQNSVEVFYFSFYPAFDEIKNDLSKILHASCVYAQTTMFFCLPQFGCI